MAISAAGGSLRDAGHWYSNLDFSSLPRWMRDTLFVRPDIPDQWTRLIRTLENPCQAPRVPFMVEELPEGFVPRPVEYERLIAHLFDERREEPVAITAAMRGDFFLPFIEAIAETHSGVNRRRWPMAHLLRGHRAPF